MFKDLVKFLGWLAGVCKSAKEFIKRTVRKYREGKVEKAVNNDNVNAIADIVRDIKKRRDKRRDSS